MPISINVSGSSFDRGSSVIGSIHESGGMAEQSDAVLVELREIRERLSEADDLSRAISSLEEAIRDQDKPKISKITKSVKSAKLLLSSPFAGFPLGKFRTHLLLWSFLPGSFFPVVGRKVGQKQFRKSRFSNAGKKACPIVSS